MPHCWKSHAAAQMRCIKVDKSLCHSQDNNFNQIAGIRTCSLSLMFCATFTGLTYSTSVFAKGNDYVNYALGLIHMILKEIVAQLLKQEYATEYVNNVK